MLELKARFNTIPEPKEDFLEQQGLHRLFLTTNEGNIEETYQKLSDLAHPIIGNTIIGTSGLFTLDAAAKRGLHPTNNVVQIENIILLDRGLRTAFFWQEAAPIISTSSYEECAQKIIDLISQHKAKYFVSYAATPDQRLTNEIQELRKGIANGHSFLSTPEAFYFIQNIFRNGNFVFKRVDLFDKGARELMKITKECNLSIDTLYLSSIEEYAYTMVEKAMLRAFVKEAVHPSTLIIHTKFRTMREMACAEVVTPLLQTVDTIDGSDDSLKRLLPIDPTVITFALQKGKK